MISLNTKTQTIRHGGNLDEAIKLYNMPKENWIDLSTGISPWAYPVKNVPEYVWHELPPSHNELLASAASYYKTSQSSIMVTPGSQIAIRLLPQLFTPTTVAVPALGYKEHDVSWQMADHKIIRYFDTTELLELVRQKRVEHVVIINPNNPSGEKFDIHTLEKISLAINGICVIDEAFIDYYENNNDFPSISSATETLKLSNFENLIILRSIGKFFGLAGIRLGFVIGSHPRLTKLNTLLQPWPISHASQFIGIQALSDDQWQQQQRIHIKQQQYSFQNILNDFLANNLEDYSCIESGLFNTVFSCKTSLKKLHEQLATQGIWTRLDDHKDQPSWLRFGLPKDMAQFKQRLNKQ